MPEPPAPSPAPPLTFTDIQANILGVAALPFARHAFLGIQDAALARAWLAAAAARVTSAEVWSQGRPDSVVNLALSFSGLRALGLAESTLDSFPDEFQQGMAARSTILSDDGLSAPERWDPPLGTHEVHVLVWIDAGTTGARQAIFDEVVGPGLAAGALVSKYVCDCALPLEHREHFGFADGMGQPSIEGSNVAALPGQGAPIPGGWRPLKAGEFILGLPDEESYVALRPAPAELARNGTFLVWRKLYQDVAKFRAFLKNGAQALFGSSGGDAQELLAAKMVGRWRSGAPLMVSPDEDDAELAQDADRNGDFRYGTDPAGKLCPRGAHIRRLNPRDALDGTATDVSRHRILRRGLPYGPVLPPDAEGDDGQDRGLAFVAINASIARQYEFIEQEWVNNGNFLELDRAERDPVMGATLPPGKITVPGANMPFAFGLSRFVTTRGGEYFFLPGINALRALAAGRFAVPMP